MFSIEIKFTNMMFLFIVFAVSFHGYSSSSVCDLINEVQCDDGSCVTKIQWCDGVVDCWDNSDEKYCNGKIPCRKTIHFECVNKKCIPASAVCDAFDDCHDRSDENNCTGARWLEEDLVLIGKAPTTPNTSTLNTSSIPAQYNIADKDALEKAVQYLLNMKSSDDGWGAFTPRAVIALSMASKTSSVAKNAKHVILKQLNIKILQDLMRNKDVTLSTLALYINALYATCQDPRNFQGLDLVARLRLETDKAVISNTSIPLAFMTLCLSNAMKQQDNYQLAKMYNSKDLGKRTGSRALISMAMTCIMHKDYPGIFREYVSNFFLAEFKRSQTDIYTQALFMQASIAAGLNYQTDIISKQLPDGSFGDMLSTYYAIPVLLNSSLLDLICHSPEKRSVPDFYPDKAEGVKKVLYSLWIPSGKDVISHSITVEFYGKKSLFYIMSMAASKDPLYKFLYEELDPEGIRVYSVAGIPNDVESGTSWLLYVANKDDVKVNSVEGLSPLEIGVDYYYPADNDHLVLWLKRNSSH